MRPSFVPFRLLLLGCLLLAGLSPLVAATYYVDPAAGKINNPGTAARPWNTLEAVFKARKSFSGGDVIILRKGFHGSPTVIGRNARDVVIRPESGHTPLLARLLFKDAARWKVSGLDICPEHERRGKFASTRLVDISENSSHITVADCRLRSAFSISGWKEKDWKTKVSGGVISRAPHSVITGNEIQYVSSGVYLHEGAVHSEVSYNVVDSVRDDGFRGNASDCQFEYNTLMNMYDISDNHDDAFQSFSTTGRGGKGIGKGVVKNVVLRGNVFISYTDPKQPYKSIMQGIACFDGMYEGWVIENNVIVTETYHGITLMGAVNCRIVNNTVIKNPINARGPSPWIRVTPHKTGRASKGNIVRNNITSSLSANNQIGVVERNLVTRNYLDVFTDWKNFDFGLKADSPARDAGHATHAPRIDANQLVRDGAIDLGAFEFKGKGGKPVGSGSKPSTSRPDPETPSQPKPAPVQDKPKEDKPKNDQPKGQKPKAKTVSFETHSVKRAVKGGSAAVAREGQASGGRVLYFGAKRKGDAITFTTGNVQPGTYTVKVRIKRGKNRGQLRVQVDGRNVGGSFDQYAATNGYREYTIGRVTVKDGGAQQVRIISDGKHRKAKAHTLALDRITFVAR